LSVLPCLSYGELALDEHGKIVGLRSKSLFQMGAYFVGAALAAGAFSLRDLRKAVEGVSD
jgi:hypothetical protein